MHFITADWPAPRHIRAFTTVKNSWRGPLKQELASDYDQPLTELLHLPNNPIWVKQTHSAIALEATPENKHQEGDACYTNQTHQVCAVLTADCLPVFICNKQGTHVAAIHAGWRGLAAGVIENTLKRINQKPEDILVWLGPAIGPDKFEVGLDVYQTFTRIHPETIEAFIPLTQDKWLADLYKIAKIRLNIYGINQVFGGKYCTYTQDDLFFSYRRNKGRTGSMASVIWMEPMV